MEIEKECGDCGFSIPDDQVVSHLQSYHVGPRHFESIIINCGECSLALPLSDASLRLMIRHCHVTGHSPQDLITEWQQFMENENRRLARLLQLGVGIEAGAASPQLVPEETPVRKRKFLSKQDSAGQLTGKSRAKQERQKTELSALFADDKEHHSPSPMADIPVLQDQGQVPQPESKPVKRRKKEKLNKSASKVQEPFNAEDDVKDPTIDSAQDSAPNKSTKGKKRKQKAAAIVKQEFNSTNIFVSNTENSVNGDEHELGSLQIAEIDEPLEDETEEEEGVAPDPQNLFCPPAEGSTNPAPGEKSDEEKDPPENKEGEQESGPETYGCSLCEFQAQKKDVRRRPKMLLHSMSHDKSLYPFKCTNCPYRAPTTNVFMSHKKGKVALAAGCDGGYENIQTPESIAQMRRLLAQVFPDVEWDVAIPPGTTLAGTKL